MSLHVLALRAGSVVFSVSMDVTFLPYMKVVQALSIEAHYVHGSYIGCNTLTPGQTGS